MGFEKGWVELWSHLLLGPAIYSLFGKVNIKTDDQNVLIS